MCHFELQKREDVCERDTPEKSFLKKTWENSLKTLEYVFLRFICCLCVKFTVKTLNLVDLQ